jgi:DNA polymerase-3 subunit alpha
LGACVVNMGQERQDLNRTNPAYAAWQHYASSNEWAEATLKRLDDLTGSTEVVVFNSTYAAARELLEADRILVVKGRVDHKQAGETKLVASEVSAFESALVRREVRLRIDARQAPAGLIRELAVLVSDYPGDAPVYVALETSLGERTLALGPEYRVKPEADFFAEVRALLGEAAIAS